MTERLERQDIRDVADPLALAKQHGLAIVLIPDDEGLDRRASVE